MDKEKDSSAGAAEDEAAQNQFAACRKEDSAGQAPWRQPNETEPIQERHRNPGQASSSSSTPAPDAVAAEPAGRGLRLDHPVTVEGEAAAECAHTDSEHLSQISEATEAPPPTEVPSPEDGVHPSS